MMNQIKEMIKMFTLHKTLLIKINMQINKEFKKIQIKTDRK